MYSLLADLVVTVHLFWIAFLIGGALIGRKRRWVMVGHLCSLAFSFLLQLKGWICPLTHLEQYLRDRAGGGYTGPFIQHYVEELVYLPVSPKWVLGGTVVVTMGSLYLYRPGLTDWARWVFRMIREKLGSEEKRIRVN